MQHFLSHAIDHFTREELTHFQYAIISAKITNGGRAQNVVKINELYPLNDIVIDYAECKDKDIMEKMYMDYLLPKKSKEYDQSDADIMANIFYRTFVNPLVNHNDIIIICDRIENDYIDVICKVLKDEYSIDVIDLNKLFIDGHIGPIYIDRKDIWDKCVDIRRIAAANGVRALESTSDGRMKLLKMMTKKQKIEKIKELGIRINDYDKKDLNQILIDAWVEDDD